MEFDCTKEGKNIYFACREKAAKWKPHGKKAEEQKGTAC